jgi:hypothetical protein
MALLVVAVSGWCAAAHAQPKDACLDGAVHGLGLRDRKAWIDAREQFRACSNAACPPGVRKDCATWLRQVEAGLPMVILSATDAAGRELTDVHVTIDGALLATRLDGTPVEVNPGAHMLRFEFADGGVVEQEVTFSEGNKKHRVLAVQPAPAPPPASPPSPAFPEAPSRPTEQGAPAGTAAGADAAGSGNGQRTLGLALGGIGAAGLVTGAIVGLLASSTWSSARNDCKPNDCGAGSAAQNERSEALGLATASTVAFAAGGAALAAGAVLFFTAPRRSREGARLMVAPAVGSVSGVFVTGVFE